jgi:hypothetical protein
VGRWDMGDGSREIGVVKNSSVITLNYVLPAYYFKLYPLQTPNFQIPSPRFKLF